MKTFHEIFEKAESDPEFHCEYEKIRIGEMICESANNAGMSIYELQNKLGDEVSLEPILSGDACVTIRDLSFIAHAIGKSLSVSLVDKDIEDLIQEVKVKHNEAEEYMETYAGLKETCNFHAGNLIHSLAKRSRITKEFLAELVDSYGISDRIIDIDLDTEAFCSIIRYLINRGNDGKRYG